VFSPAAFEAICSDLSGFAIAEAVHASMAVPLVFAPVVLQSFPQACATPLPAWVGRVAQDPGASRSALAVALAVQNYRDPARQRYLKLVDGGVTDNYGLTSIVVGRATGGTPHAPLTARDAVQVRRMLFLVVDAGRSPSGDWALQPEGPSAVDMALAATDSAIDSATRLGFEVFRNTLSQWEADVRRFRCALRADELKTLREPDPTGTPWDCRDVRFELGVIRFSDLDSARADQLNRIPTRLTLPAADIDAAIEAGRDAALLNAPLQRYQAERGSVTSPGDR
jgi:NTE family protein